MDRSRIPVSSTVKEFHLPLPVHVALNGSADCLLLTKSNLPMVQLNVLINAGSKYDLTGKSGTAYLVSSLLDEGAGEFDALTLSSRFERLGTRLSIFCNHDDLVLSLTALEEYIDESAALLALVLGSPRFDERDFSRERTRLQTALLRRKDEPSDIADLVFDRLLFPGTNPYGEPLTGTIASVAGLNREDIMQFYTARVNARGGRFSLVGNFTPEAAAALLNRRFPGMQQPWEDAFVVNNEMQNIPGIYVVDKPGSVQTEIRCGHLSNPRNSSDYFAKYLVNFILGGQFNSRLNKNLREKQGFTYGISSNFLYHREQGYFAVTTSAGGEQTGKALVEILNELKQMAHGPTAEELTAAKTAVIRRLPAQFESYAQTASNLSLLARQNLPLNYFTTYPEQIRSVTLADSCSAAAARILPDALTIVLTGDKGVITNALREEGLSVTAECTDDGEII